MTTGRFWSHTWPTGPWSSRIGLSIPGRHVAYERCLKKRRQEARWIAFLDIDEFLFSPLGRPVPELVGEFEQYPGIGVNLSPFGTSGHETEPDGLVIENFSRRSKDEETQPTIKSIVNPLSAIHCWGAHSFLYLGWLREYQGATFDEPVWGLVQAVSELRHPIDLQLHDRTPELSYSLLRVNHYCAKSRSGFSGERRRAERTARRHHPDVRPVLTRGYSRARRRLTRGKRADALAPQLRLHDHIVLRGVRGGIGTRATFEVVEDRAGHVPVGAARLAETQA